MIQADFEKLQEYLDKKISFTKDNAEIKLQELPNIHQNLIKVLASIHSELNTLQRQQGELHGQLLKFYKFESDYRWENQKETEWQIKSNAKYIALQEKIDVLEVQSDYIGKTFDNIKNVGYAVKNYIEWKRFVNGD